MEIIKVHRFYFYGLIVGIFIGIIFLLVGVFTSNILAGLLGIFLLGVCLVLYYKASTYNLVLELGLLKETVKGKVLKVHFKDIKKLDTEIYLGGRTASYHPVFYLEQNGEIIKFKTQEQASVYDIVEWIKINYPKTEITKDTQRILNWAKSGTWLWKSI